MNAAAETCSTLLTPSGVGAIGVIRVCGPDALSVIGGLFQSDRVSALNSDSLPDGRLRYGRLMDGAEVLDDVLVSAVTGSVLPAFDITAHGGVRVLERILTALESRGAPFLAADPEFTPFPVENHLEREALSQLRRARTARAVSFLARQRTALPRALIDLIALLPDDAPAARSALSALLLHAPAALNLIHGVTVVLVGPPNSGKSTLFNRLVGRPAAIVSAQPGTTRDWITADLDMHGLPVNLVDTAGVRAEAAALEREAIARGQCIADASAIRLLVLDTTHPIPLERSLLDWCADPPTAILLNKIDACPNSLPTQVRLPARLSSVPILHISAATGVGLSALSKLILQDAGLDDSWDQSLPAFFTQRQIHLANQCLRAPSEEFTASTAAMHAALLSVQVAKVVDPIKSRFSV